MAAIVSQQATAIAIVQAPSSSTFSQSFSSPRYLFLQSSLRRSSKQQFPLCFYNSELTISSVSSPVPLIPNLQLSNPNFPLPSFVPNNLRNKYESESIIRDYIDLLRLSVRHRDIKLTKVVHSSILKLQEDTYLCNALISAYLKFGLINHAFKVFYMLSSPDVVSYTTLISGFAKCNREIEALKLFFRMRNSGISPNEFSFVAILTACVRLMDLELGFQVHSLAIKMGYLGSTFVSNALMGLYSKCDCLDLVYQLFDEMPQRDVASWNTVIAGAVKEKRIEKAFQLFRSMHITHFLEVDHFTISTLLSASGDGLAITKGREIHAHAIKVGLETNLSVNNALIGYYIKHGKVDQVEALFEKMIVKDTITWTEMIVLYMDIGRVELAMNIFRSMPEKNCISYNALLAGLCRNEKGSTALDLFCRMVREGIELSEFTLTSAISACGSFGDLKISQQVHAFVIKFGIKSNDLLEAALIEMCARCGRLDDAEIMFQDRPIDDGNPVIWTSMISSYAQNGRAEDAISLFLEGLLENGFIIDNVLLTTILGLCGTLGFQFMGEQLHCLACKSGLISDIGVGNALTSMYFKSWSPENAINIFNSMAIRDLVSWNCMLAGYLLHRRGDEILSIWSRMEREGIKPDYITFLCVISAYRYTEASLIDQCRKLFLSMRSSYGIEPTSNHYASMVSVLGSRGLLVEAMELITKMPFKADVLVWRSLLDACRIHSDITIGEYAAKQILSMEPKDVSTYVLVSNLYSSSARWKCAESVRDEMIMKGFCKLPVRSWVVNENAVESFYARDQTHPRSKDVWAGLEILILECLKVGYVADTRFVLHEVGERQKKDFLFYHSAKLATSYGLLTTKRGKPVRVVKNVVLCGDCHTFMKYVSVVTRKEIHFRDASGFHCFRDGLCSCKDYW
ncbi:pentatricopeptide repeat-containing protein At5g03800 [Impatiens glandulifera]|uniref:pentatricopeptide repeat-containing protein At5g03800 n=1 Tax=Impatiens glandulifera TaxID=253017 RepID=UPI001FB06D0A|nr:pentatricopeptide repeat-containing protein At5g03800 [Impatiens glandulifera]